MRIFGNSLATPKSIAFQVITLLPKELLCSRRMQIVAKPVLFDKGSENIFAQASSVRDKWDKQHEHRKQFAFSHILGRHAVFPTCLCTMHLTKKVHKTFFKEYW